MRAVDVGLQCCNGSPYAGRTDLLFANDAVAWAASFRWEKDLLGLSVLEKYREGAIGWAVAQPKICG